MAESKQPSAPAAAPGLKNEKVGQVVSTEMRKTIVVEVSRRVPHPLYKRIINKRKKFYAHDEESSARMGDVVRIVECRPLSKLKRWRLDGIVRRAAQVGTQPADLDVQVGHVEAPGDGAPARLQLRVVEVAGVAAHALIAARAERLVALAREHDHADLRVLARVLERA